MELNAGTMGLVELLGVIEEVTLLPLTEWRVFLSQWLRITLQTLSIMQHLQWEQS